MRRSPFSLLLSLSLQTLTLTLALTSHQQDESGNTTSILQDVLKEISARQKWTLDEISFSKLEVKKVRIGSGQRFEVRIRFGKSRFVFFFPDEIASWRQVAKGDIDFEDLIKEVSSSAVLDSLVLEGPFELIVAGDDLLSLALPMNNSYTGLKRLLVGEGISVEVRRAKEVSLFRSADLRFPIPGGVINDQGRNLPWSSWHSQCIPLLPIQIIGSASLTAYRSRNSHSYIKSSFLSNCTIQLHPEKCYNRHIYKPPRYNDLLGLKMDRLDKVLSSLGNITRGKKLLGLLNARLKASGIIRFQLEIERKIGKNDTVHGKLAEWRTRPSVERVWFEVTVKIDGEKLKPVMIKKVLPFIEVDTVAWSSLMSNISFTKFPSILVPQEALTLDVKW